MGYEARAFVANLILGKEVKVMKTDTDRYKRNVAIVEINGASVAYLLVRQGLSHVSTKYCRNEALIAEYRKALIEKRGLFAHNWILPSQFRKQKR